LADLPLAGPTPTFAPHHRSVFLRLQRFASLLQKKSRSYEGG
jgi:hypothetical protein